MMYWKPFRQGLTCALCGLVAFAVTGWASTVDRIVAKVNKEIITQSELEERAVYRIINLQKMNVKPLPAKEEVMYEELERMIEERLLVDAGEKLQLNVNEASVNKAIDEIKRDNGISDENLMLMLEAESKTMDDYKKKIRNQILMSQVINYEVRKRAVVSDEEIEQYYDQHQKDFWVTGKLKLRHILFLLEEGLPENEKLFKRQKAQEALHKIRSGEKFEVIAKKYSEDVSAAAGGDLGVVERGTMVPEFEKAAFLLKEGEVSDIVKSPYGLHIIKVDQILPGRTLPLDDVKTQITNKFRNEKLVSVTKAYLLELREKAFVEIKISPPPKPEVKEAMLVEPNGASQPAPHGKGDLVDLAPAPLMDEPQPKVSQNLVPPRFQTFEEKLRYYKELRDNKKITEGEYRERKEALLNNL